MTKSDAVKNNIVSVRSMNQDKFEVAKQEMAE